MMTPFLNKSFVFKEHFHINVINNKANAHEIRRYPWLAKYCRFYEIACLAGSVGLPQLGLLQLFDIIKQNSWIMCNTDEDNHDNGSKNTKQIDCSQICPNDLTLNILVTKNVNVAQQTWGFSNGFAYTNRIKLCAVRALIKPIKRHCTRLIGNVESKEVLRPCKDVLSPHVRPLCCSLASWNYALITVAVGFLIGIFRCIVRHAKNVKTLLKGNYLWA